MHFSFVKQSLHQFCIQILSRCTSNRLQVTKSYPTKRNGGPLSQGPRRRHLLECTVCERRGPCCLVDAPRLHYLPANVASMPCFAPRSKELVSELEELADWAVWRSSYEAVQARAARAAGSKGMPRRAGLAPVGTRALACRRAGRTWRFVQRRLGLLSSDMWFSWTGRTGGSAADGGEL